MRLPKDEQKKLVGMLGNNPSLYKFILHHGDLKTRLVLSNMYVLRVASFVYINLHSIKKKLRNREYRSSRQLSLI